ncbi:MAG: cellulase family glycosylhydrolase [Terracidiphilus sp.]
MRFWFGYMAMVVTLAASASASASAQGGAGAEIAFARAQHLRHGINASEWFAQSGDYSAARTNRYTDAQDIALMARLGFDHVRLSIDAGALEQDPRAADGLNADFLARLDRAIDTMLGDGLAVEVDMHPGDAYKQQLRSGDDAVERFTALWRKLATHYANRDPERVFFEILNEPEVSDPYRWAGIQAHVAEAIRQVAPRHTLIATGANYSGMHDLLQLEPLADGNVIYTFHFYEPHEFTHQGANWGVAWWSETQSIPYPVPNFASSSDLQAFLHEVPDAADRSELEDYFLDGWDARHIRLVIDEAADWARNHHVPLLCNEFGAYRPYADPVSRANWIRDTRTALEADGIGWAMWDYRGGFGVVIKQDSQPAQVDETTVRALGLRGR